MIAAAICHADVSTEATAEGNAEPELKAAPETKVEHQPNAKADPQPAANAQPDRDTKAKHHQISRHGLPKWADEYGSSKSSWKEGDENSFERLSRGRR